MSSRMPISFALQVQGAEQVKGQINGVGGSMRNLGKQANTASAAAQPVQRNYQQAALGISAVATSATAAVFSFQNLQKSTLGVDRAEKDLIDKTRALGMARETLNRLTEQGKTETAQYQFALQDLDSKTRDLTISQESLKLAQQDASNAQLQFGMSVLPAVLTSVTTMRGAIGGLNLGMRTTGTVAAPMASQGMRKFGMATRLAQLAMGPFGIAMLAIGAAFTAVATNAFGLRDAMDSFAKKIEQIFPVIRPVFDFFRDVSSTLFPDTEKSSKELERQITGDFGGMAGVVQTSTSQQSGALNALGTSFTTVQQTGSNQIKTLAGSVDSAADDIVRDAARIDNALGKVGVSIASPATAPSVSSAQRNTREISNPLGLPGLDTTVFDPLIGSLRLSEIRKQIATPQSSINTDVFRNISSSGGGRVTNEINVILDGERIAAKVEQRQKNSTRAEMGSIT